MRQLETYSYTIPAGQTINLPAANDNFIILAATGPVTVRGDTFGTLKDLVAGQGLKMVPFNRLELINTSGAPNTVSILLTPAEFVNQVFSGSVQLVQSSLDALVIPPQSTGNYKAITALAANTADALFTSAANTGGAILLNAEASIREVGYQRFAFVAKATAPATVVDGELMAQSRLMATDVGGTSYEIQLANAAYVPAGLGLYFISETALSAGTPNIRSARYRLL